MEISKAKNENKTTLTLSGRLNSTTASKLQEALIPEFAGTKLVELDFADLSYVSSAGLRVLLFSEKTAKANGCRLTLINVSGDIMEIFEMTGLADVLNIE